MSLPCVASLKKLISSFYYKFITNNLDNISSKTLLEKRWQYKYRSLMNSISQFNLEDETGTLRLSGNAASNRSYLTIQGIPRRPRSYLQLENNLRNLFDSPSSPPPAVHPSGPATTATNGAPSSTPPPSISGGDTSVYVFGSNRNRSRTNS